MTRRERMQRRAERRQVWAESARAVAAHHFDAADHALDGIEPGQPILVGHHSERRHRGALARCDSNMRAGFERERMAQRHTVAADTLEERLQTSVFSDDENAHEALSDRIAKRERFAARMKALNAAIRKELKAGLTDGWLDRIGATEQEREALLLNARAAFDHSPLFRPYVFQNLSGRNAADRKRLADVTRQRERAASAEDVGGVLIQRFPEPNWCRVTFAEKPARDVLDALRGAGYRFGSGSWQGYLSALPGCVEALATVATADAAAVPTTAETPCN